MVAYALSPIDLIPDFIPVLGYVDDLFIVPLGIATAVRMIPPEVMDEHRARVDAAAPRSGIVAAAVIVAVWLILGAAAFGLVARALFG